MSSQRFLAEIVKDKIMLDEKYEFYGILLKINLYIAAGY